MLPLKDTSKRRIMATLVTIAKLVGGHMMHLGGNRLEMSEGKCNIKNKNYEKRR